IPGPDAIDLGVDAFKAGRIAENIATGHALEKHLIEYSEIGIQDATEFKVYVDSVMLNPTSYKPLERGRVGFLDESTGTVVIYDPKNPDLGTAFIPPDPVGYYNNLR